LNAYLKEFNRNTKDPWDIDRRALVDKYSWAIPNEQAIDLLVRYSPIIEIGAGSGYWASLVAEAGGEIVAFDLKYDRWNRWHTYHYRVRYGGATKVPQYPNHTLFLCWPPYHTDMAYKTLNLYGGKYFIYVGESEGGCTGSNKFFDLLNTDYILLETVEIPQHYGLRDELFLYQRGTKC
jgi:hypothetical protein